MFCSHVRAQKRVLHAVKIKMLTYKGLRANLQQHRITAHGLGSPLFGGAFVLFHTNKHNAMYV